MAWRVGTAAGTMKTPDKNRQRLIKPSNGPICNGVPRVLQSGRAASTGKKIGQTQH